MFCLAEPPRTLEARVCSGSVVGRRERREAGRADRAREVSAPSGEVFGPRVRGGDACRCGNHQGDPLSLLKRRPGGSRACRPDCSASTEVRRAIPSAATPKRRKLSHSPRLREPHPGGLRGLPHLSDLLLDAVGDPAQPVSPLAILCHDDPDFSREPLNLGVNSIGY